MKHFFKTILVLVSFSFILLFSCAFTTFRGETGSENANVVPYDTPIGEEQSQLIWSRSFLRSGLTSYNSIPILTDQSIYLANADILYEMDKKGTILRQMTLPAKINSVCYMLLEKNQLYIPLNGGRMTCINIDSMTQEWCSESFGGQSLSTVFYYNGYVFAGTTNITSRGTTGIFYCLNTIDGSTVWTYEDASHPGGYYWSGSIVRDDTLFFTGDNGILVSHSITEADVYDTKCITDKANIRTGLTYDLQTNALYTASNDGTLYRITTDRSKIHDISSIKLYENDVTINCTSTPTIYNGRIYIGYIADRVGRVAVIDAKALAIIYQVQGFANAEIKSSPLLSTRGDTSGQVTVYVSANAFPGGIYYFTDSGTTTSSTLQTLFIPAAAKQFCLSSICAGKDGTLYYSNDSGTFFAIGKKTATADEGKKTVLSASGSKDSKNSSYIRVVVRKPNHIRIKKKKKIYKISWKKPKKTQTILYQKTGRKKWKKKIIKTKTYLSIKKKKHPVRFRLRVRKKTKGIWYYSGYTKTFYLK